MCACWKLWTVAELTLWPAATRVHSAPRSAAHHTRRPHAGPAPGAGSSDGAGRAGDGSDGAAGSAGGRGGNGRHDALAGRARRGRGAAEGRGRRVDEGFRRQEQGTPVVEDDPERP